MPLKIRLSKIQCVAASVILLVLLVTSSTFLYSSSEIAKTKPHTHDSNSSALHTNLLLNLYKVYNYKMPKPNITDRDILSSHGRSDNDDETCNDDGSIRSSTYSKVQLTMRALRLCLNFSPVVFTAPLAYVSEMFRTHVWFKLVKESLAVSGPSFIKWGQWSSNREDMFPPALCQILENLQTDAPTHSWSFTKSVIEEGLNNIDIYEVFEKFEEQPIASGSIAQVHKAVLKSVPYEQLTKNQQKEAKVRVNEDRYYTMDRTVAVKVRHPGVGKMIDMDFRIMRSVAQFLDSFPSLEWLNIGSSVDQFSHTMAAQIDLEVEAHHLNILNYNFRDWDSVSFPRPVFATETMIVETFERGETANSLVSVYDKGGHLPLDLEEFIVTTGVSIYLKMLIVDNLMHADLHPGNFMISHYYEVEGTPQSYDNHHRKNLTVGSSASTYKSSNRYHKNKGRFHGHINLVDAGMVAQLDVEESTNFIGLMASLGEGDATYASDAILGFSKKQVISNQEKEAFRQDMVRLFNQICRGYGTNVQVGEVLRGVLKLIREHHIRIDANYATLVINVLCIEGLGKQISPNYNILDSAKPVLSSFYKLCKKDGCRKPSMRSAMLKLSMPFLYHSKSSSDRKYFKEVRAAYALDDEVTDVRNLDLVEESRGALATISNR